MIRLFPLRRVAGAVLALGALQGGLASAPASAEARKPAGPCAAAVAAENYGSLVTIPAPLKTEITAYRAGWKAACAKKGGASLAALLAQGDRIGKALDAIAEKTSTKGSRLDDLHTLWRERYPRFIPAFHGSIIEFNYIEPDLAVFARHAALGDAQDKTFLAAHRPLYGTDAHAFPWIKRSWDYGGCVRFGQYDWVAAVARIEGLESKLTAPAYRTRLAALKERIRNYLRSPAAERDGKKKPVVDSCAPRAQTVAALETTMRGLEKRKGWEPVAAGLRKTLDDIRAGRTEICNDCLR